MRLVEHVYQILKVIYGIFLETAKYNILCFNQRLTGIVPPCGHTDYY